MTVLQIAGLTTILGSLSLLAGCAASPPDNLGVRPNGTLAPCPNSPNCVSSFAAPSDKEHYIKPLRGGPGDWKALQTVLEEKPQFTIVRQESRYMHVEARTRIMHFVDDLEFVEQPSKQLIQVRSASRIGYSDFGKNRSRLEALREQLNRRQR